MSGNLARRALLPSFEVVLFLLIFWISLLLMPDMLNSDGDLGRHLTVGNYILDTRSIPTRDVFSDTRYGAPLVLHEWLSEVTYALAWRAAGLNGAAWFTAGLLALIYFTVAAGLRMLGVSAPLAFLAGLAAFFTGAIHHLPRPHLFTLLCFTLLLLLLELYRRDERPTRLLLALPLMALWANFNGAFVLAFIVAGIYIVGAVLDREPRRALILCGLAGALFVASLSNPYGLELPRYVFEFMGNRFLVDNTVEYASPDFHNLAALPFALWIGFSIALMARVTTRIAWTPLLLLVVWTGFGLYSARNIANYAQVAAFVTAPLAEAWAITRLPALRLRLSNLNRVAPIGAGWVWLAVVVAALIGLEANGIPLDARGRGNTFSAPTFPVQAVDALEGNLPQGRVFNEYTWGGYLLYRQYPKLRVFIDGNNDFYGETLVRDYLDMVNAREGWAQKLEQYQVNWVILPPRRGLAQELARSSEWREIYRDASAGVWVRK